MITIFKSMDSKGQPEHVEIDEVLGKIKQGVNRSLLAKIRAEKVKSIRDQLKRGLLWILFSGQFSERLNEAMVQHSGFICLDFDGMSDSELKYWRAKVKADKHTYCVFLSPSGNGLKAIWRIPVCASNDEHNRRFDAIAKYWNECKFFDRNVKGWNRVCFESFDPDLIINHESAIFEGIESEVEITNTRTYAAVTDESEEIFKRVVVWFEREHNLNKGNRDKGAFVFATGVANYLPETIGYNLAFDYISRNVEQVPGDAFTTTQIDKCIKQAYRKNPTPTKSFNLNTYTPREVQLPGRFIVPDNAFDDIVFVEPVITHEDEVIYIPTPKPEPDEEIVFFWYYGKKGALNLDFHAMRKFLHDNGFFRYEFVPEKVNFIRIENNIVSSVTANDIKNFLLEKLDKWNEIDVYNFVAQFGKFKDEYLSLLEIKEPNFLEDDRKTAWFFYRNTAVKVTSEGVEEVPYDKINGCIWKSSILKRDFMSTGYDGCDFSKFLWNVCNNDAGRLRALCSSLGYLLHRYKDPSNPKGIIFYEEQVSDKPQGGTGKTLIFQAVGEIRNLVTLDAKAYDNNNQFALQRVDVDTNIIMFDDLPRNFKYEELFSKMSTGLPINKKNKPEIYLPYKKAPKYCFPSNYVIKGESSSFKRRKFEIEIFPFYSETHQPIDDFEVPFWSEDWTEERWFMFDNLMLNCCKLFLREGLIVPVFVNLALKKIIAETSTDFFDWANDNLKNNERYHRGNTYDEFKSLAEKTKSFCPTSRLFYDWLRDWGTYKGWKVSDAVGAGRMYLDFGNGGELELGDEWLNVK